MTALFIFLPSIFLPPTGRGDPLPRETSNARQTPTGTRNAQRAGGSRAFVLERRTPNLLQTEGRSAESRERTIFPSDDNKPSSFFCPPIFLPVSASPPLRPSVPDSAAQCRAYLLAGPYTELKQGTRAGPPISAGLYAHSSAEMAGPVVSLASVVSLLGGSLPDGYRRAPRARSHPHRACLGGSLPDSYRRMHTAAPLAPPDRTRRADASTLARAQRAWSALADTFSPRRNEQVTPDEHWRNASRTRARLGVAGGLSSA